MDEKTSQPVTAPSHPVASATPPPPNISPETGMPPTPSHTPPGPPSATEQSGKQPNKQSESGMSYETKTIIVILLLLLLYPVGLVMMFVWMKWRWWVKALVIFPVLLGILGILASVVLIAVNPAKQMQKAECATQCEQTVDRENCVEKCMVSLDESVPSSELE